MTKRFVRTLAATLALSLSLLWPREPAEGTPQAATSSQKPATVTLTDAEQGKTFRVKPGDLAVIRLPVRNGTAYVWQLVRSKQEVLALQGEPVVDPPPSVLPGGAAEYIFRFVARNHGKTKLEFEYLRPWEKDVPPAKKFSASFVVE